MKKAKSPIPMLAFTPSSSHRAAAATPPRRRHTKDRSGRRKPWCEAWAPKYENAAIELDELAAGADDVRDSTVSRAAVARALCGWDGPLEACDRSYRFRDRSDPAAVDVAFLNRIGDAMNLVYVSRDGVRSIRGQLPPGARWDEDSFGGHRYVASVKGADVAEVTLPASGVVAYALEGRDGAYSFERVDATRMARPGEMRPDLR